MRKSLDVQPDGRTGVFVTSSDAEVPVLVEERPTGLPPPVHTMVTRARDGIRRPNPKYALHIAVQSVQ